MKSNNCHNHAQETKLSEQFVEFIDLADENLEEISIPGFGRIQGGCGSCSSCSCKHHHHHHKHHSCSCSSCSCGSCSYGSCSSCDDGDNDY